MTREQKSQPVRAASILRVILDRYGLTAACSRHNVVNLWPSIVSEAVARHARAERLTASTLHIAVDSSVWMNELAAIKPLLLEKINACIETGAAPVMDIRFFQRSWAASPVPSPQHAPEQQLSEQDVRKVNRILEPVRNEDLRHLFDRILAKDLRLKKKRRLLR